MKTRWLALPLVASLSCIPVTGQPAPDPAAPADLAPAPEEAASAPDVAAAAAPADHCPPGELLVDLGAPASIDTRRGPMISVAERKRTKWPEGNWKQLTKKFLLDDARVIDLVVGLEAKNPKLLPEAFRNELLASPRDPALRLQVAVCEARFPQTRRRAAYDGALALLLGGPAEEAMRLIALGTQGASSTRSMSFCSLEDQTCDEGSYCDLERGECITQAEHVHSYIGADELTIEDALSRALVRHDLTGEGHALSADARNGWMQYAVHRCGKQLCKLTDYAREEERSDDDSCDAGGSCSRGGLAVALDPEDPTQATHNENKPYELVAYDRRDGGSVEEVPFTKKELAAREACMRRIGFPSRNACHTDCWERYYQLGSDGWAPQDACKQECDRGCDD